MFNIKLGVPEIEEKFNNLKEKKKSGNLTGDDALLFKKWGKALKFLRVNPKYPSLNTHEISDLSRRYGRKVFQSYLDQGKLAWRMYWIYGPNQKEITVIGISSHPENNKNSGYDSVTLSDIPEA